MRKSFILLLLLFVVFLIPFVGLFFATGCLILSVKIPLATSCATSIANVTVESSTLLSEIPLIGKPYLTVSSVAQFESDGASLVQKGIAIYRRISSSPSAKALTDNAPYIDQWTRDAARLFANKDNLRLINSLYPKILPLEKIVQYFPLISEILNNSGTLFSVNSSYLILFQNNMELRPTGGFIGSFALTNFSSDLNPNYQVYDVYDADGQLSGYIAPPSPIKDYLGEASWHMRDSNWDPDFSVSAKRALWFLDKTINKKAEGVVGINLEVLKRLLSVTGPIDIPDYNDKIDETNFYQLIQKRATEDFFPGSRKKSNYLTAVVNGVLTKIQKGNVSRVSLLNAILSSIEARDIQLYFDVPSVEEKVGETDISGTIPSNAIGFVEANVGVNKANQYIERIGELTVSENGDQIIQSLRIKNNASDDTDETVYKVYLRAFAPEVFTAGRAVVVSSGIEKSIAPESTNTNGRNEAGTYVEVRAGDSAQISFTWEKPDSNNLSHLVFWKQSGVSPYPLAVGRSLTNGGMTKYNTQVTSDIPIF